MFIKKIILSDFNLVKDSDISYIEIDFTEKVQIIIGTNGSGKTVTLNQLSVYPAAKSLFGKAGHKCLYIEKDDIVYRLEADYKKPSSPHGFYIDGEEENINTGGTTHVQNELLSSHLGITPLVDDLIMNRFDFPKWKPARRKEFLMENNPADIGFIFQLAKKMASEIRSCKNNLSRLQSRKILLEQDLLSDEQINTLVIEKQKISNELGVFHKHNLEVEIALKSLREKYPSPIDFDLTYVRKIIKQANKDLATLADVDRDDAVRRSKRDHLVGQLAYVDNRIKTIDQTIIDHTETLNDFEVEYKSLNIDNNLSEIELTISQLESTRDKLIIDKPSFELTHKELNQRYEEWQDINNQLLIFNECTIPLYSTKKRQYREQLLNRYDYLKSSVDYTLSDLKSQYQEVSNRHTLSPQDIPDKPCAKQACPLFTHFMDNFERFEEKRKSLSLKIERLERKSKRIAIIISSLNDYFRQSKPYHDAIRYLIEKAQQNPIIHFVLKQLDILSTLKYNPNAVAMKIKHEYDKIDQWLRYKSVLSDLETAYALRNRFIGSQSHDTVKLVVNIENIKNTLYELRKEIKGLIEQQESFKINLDKIEKYDRLKNDLIKLRNDYTLYMHQVADKHEQDKLDYLHKTLFKLTGDHFVKLSQLETSIRKQGLLKERYNEEVIAQIEKIESDRLKCEHIERALIKIPEDITIRFINEIFDKANQIIKTIWSVPFEIVLLKPGDPLDYEFMVSGDNQTIREMGQCSDGQSEMLSLAINLALRIQLGYLNLPMCLDEPAKTFDEVHKRNFITLINQLIEDKIISQLFMISHTSTIHESFSQSETLVLREENVFLPQVYNQHVTFR